MHLLVGLRQILVPLSLHLAWVQLLSENWLWVRSSLTQCQTSGLDAFFQFHFLDVMPSTILNANWPWCSIPILTFPGLAAFVQLQPLLVLISSHSSTITTCLFVLDCDWCMMVLPNQSSSSWHRVTHLKVSYHETHLFSACAPTFRSLMAYQHTNCEDSVSFWWADKSTTHLEKKAKKLLTNSHSFTSCDICIVWTSRNMVVNLIHQKVCFA